MVAPPTPKRITIQDAVDRYLDVCSARVSVNSMSAATLRNYAADLGEFASLVGEDAIVDDITGADVDAAITAFGRGADGRYKDPTDKEGPGRAPSTQFRFRQSITRFFDYAAQEAWVQVSPMPWSVLQPKVRGGLRVARTSLTMEQAAALLEHGAGEPDEHARSHERNYERDKFLLALMTILGPRVHEVVSASDEDFTMEDGVEVWRILGKGGKVRRVPLSAWLSQLKAEYLAVRPGPSAVLSPARGAARVFVRSTSGAAEVTNVRRHAPLANSR